MIEKLCRTLRNKLKLEPMVLSVSRSGKLDLNDCGARTATSLVDNYRIIGSVPILTINETLMMSPGAIAYLVALTGCPVLITMGNESSLPANTFHQQRRYVDAA